eukprot:CAMPEP_0114330380 /NCGR_PEP_ID=MMETSP0101-20121206/1714_1 /TAXON_ID=38822 ORGANISM="Pteridomonas danica, Strain PT" /NCGR_SAMPLE_ID=MMETSP0101 /ASSEMBLY_ACC=CAM_ASM_000211 /LENGTH=504 /DNA_ID=CAMNT_0001460375 /DNA_START=866 /DNA_END=2376 /DNA_ORIENTATION=-
MCFDILGIHTRAQITDVRVELFDGVWANNVGGGEFLIYYDVNGSYVYQKAVDVSILTPGPCLSNASFNGKSEEDSIQFNIKTSGTRTDDFLRVFFEFRYDILKDMEFSRLAFFQSGADSYAKNDEYGTFSYGNIYNTSNDIHMDSTCHDTYDYKESMGYRKLMHGKKAWWFAMSPSIDITTSGLGDRGYVIRDFKSKFNNIEYDSPAFSILCDKFEISVPMEVGSTLMKGDYIEFKLEFLVLPRIGDDFDYALNVQNSNTLSLLSKNYQNTSLMIKEQAMRNLNITAIKGHVESHYPVRVCANTLTNNHNNNDDDIEVLFHVDGYGLGFIPIVICGLSTHHVHYNENENDREGLWIKEKNDKKYKLLNQSVYENNDFYQTNYIESTQTYEIIFNIELLYSNSTYIAFGKYPNISKTTSHPTLLPSLLPSSSPTMVPIPAPTSVPIPSPTSVPLPAPTMVPVPVPTAIPISSPTMVPIPSPTSMPIPSPTSVPLPAPTMVPVPVP